MESLWNPYYDSRFAWGDDIAKETEAERLLYLKGAFELYAKDGNAEKAIETVGMIRTQIPDIPPANLSNIIKSGVRSADKKTKASIAAFWDEIKSREAARKLVAGDVPKVLKTVPANGDRNVDPATHTIVIAFDQPMGDGYALCRGVGVSWNESPETVGKPVWNAAKTTIAFPVKLRSGWHYKMSINREGANSFRNAKGVPVPDTDYEFWTTGKAEPMTDLPKVVKISPANGAKDARVFSRPWLIRVRSSHSRPSGSRAKTLQALNSAATARIRFMFIVFSSR